MGIADEFAEGEHVFGRVDADGGDLIGIGPEEGELAVEIASLLPGAGDDDGFAKKRALFEPVDLFAEAYDVADSADGGGFETGVFDFLGDGFEGADESLLLAGGGPAHHGDGCFGRSSSLDKRIGDRSHALDTHEHDLGAGGFGELFVIDAALGLRGIFVTGEDSELGIVGAVGDGDAGVAGTGDGGANSRDDFKRDPSGAELLRLFTSTAEDHGVAAFEADDGFPFIRFVDEKLVDPALGDGVVAGFFSSVDLFATLWRPTEHLGIRKVIVNEDIGLLDELFGAEGAEAEVAGAGAYEVTVSWIHVGRCRGGLAASQAAGPVDLSR